MSKIHCISYNGCIFTRSSNELHRWINTYLLILLTCSAKWYSTSSGGGNVNGFLPKNPEWALWGILATMFKEYKTSSYHIPAIIRLSRNLVQSEENGYANSERRFYVISLVVHYITANCSSLMHEALSLIIVIYISSKSCLTISLWCYQPSQHILHFVLYIHACMYIDVTICSSERIAF